MFKRTIAASILASSVAALVAPAPAEAARPDIVIPKGQTTLFSVPEGVDRVVVGDSNVADVVVLPSSSSSQSRDVLINGKNPGFTNFLVFLAKGGFRNYKLEVTSAGRDETIAVRVQVLEATERKLGNTGVKWSDSLGITEAAPNAPFRIGLPVRTDLLTANLNLLSQEREIKILAAPTLVIQNGKKGSFLSGGEVPIPVQQGTGANISYSIDWKQFGVKLDVEPRLEGNMIAMNLRPEVSYIDQENAIKLNNLSVPGLSTRWTQSSVQVGNGESIVIAGLLRNEKQRAGSRLPYLGDIPFLGALFGATQYDERVSELVFVVTPTVLTNSDVLPEKHYGTGRPGQTKK